MLLINFGRNSCGSVATVVVQWRVSAGRMGGVVEDLLGLNEVLRSLRPGYLTKEVRRTIVRSH